MASNVTAEEARAIAQALAGSAREGDLDRVERRDAVPHQPARLPLDLEAQRREGRAQVLEQPARVDLAELDQLELVRAAAAHALEPHDELFQPSIASFEPGSAELSAASVQYIDRLADTLRPGRTQVLIVEGHALDADARWQGDDHWLAFARAEAVRRRLVEEHGYPAEGVEARAWLIEVEPEGPGTRCVDARLVTPSRKQK